MDYQGKKFYYSGFHKESRYNPDSLDYEIKIVNDYKMTRGYRKYLQEKKEREWKEKAIALRHKLEYQMARYGEVDELDYQEFIRFIQG